MWAKFELLNSAVGQIFLASAAYSVLSVLIFGGYFSYFSGGYSVFMASDFTVQDLIFFMPSIVVGFVEWVGKNFGRFMEAGFKYIIVPFGIGWLIAAIIVKMFTRAPFLKLSYGTQVFWIGFWLWYLSVFLAMFEALRSRRWKWVFFALQIIGLVLSLLFVPDTTVSASSAPKRHSLLLSAISGLGGGILFLVTPIVFGKTVAQTLVDSGLLSDIGHIEAKRPLRTLENLSSFQRIEGKCSFLGRSARSFFYRCRERVVLVASLRNSVVLYTKASDLETGHLLVLPLSSIIAIDVIKEHGDVRA